VFRSERFVNFIVILCLASMIEAQIICCFATSTACDKPDRRSSKTRPHLRGKRCSPGFIGSSPQEVRCRCHSIRCCGVKRFRPDRKSNRRSALIICYRFWWRRRRSGRICSHILPGADCLIAASLPIPVMAAGAYRCSGRFQKL